MDSEKDSIESEDYKTSIFLGFLLRDERFIEHGISPTAEILSARVKKLSNESINRFIERLEKEVERVELQETLLKALISEKHKRSETQEDLMKTVKRIRNNRRLLEGVKQASTKELQERAKEIEKLEQELDSDLSLSPKKPRL